MRALILRHIACEGPGLLGDFLRGHGVGLTTIELDRGEAIPDPLDFDLLVAMGGPMNVYEEARYPFLVPENLAIQRAVAGGVPYLGLCLGGQLLAKALGASVTGNPVKEIGFSEVSLTPDGGKDPLLAGLADPLPVFQWHGDTFAIPAGAAHLASSPPCRNQAFRAGEAAWGLQFHIEVTREMVDEWFRLYAEEAARTPGVDPARILAEAGPRLARIGPEAERMFENLLGAVATRARGAPRRRARPTP